MVESIGKTSPNEMGVRANLILEQRDAITKSGVSLIRSMLEKLKDLNSSTITINTETIENIGGTYFPVTYCENGMVIIDYPNTLLSKK